MIGRVTAIVLAFLSVQFAAVAEWPGAALASETEGAHAASPTGRTIHDFTVNDTMSEQAINAVLAQAAAVPGSTVRFTTGRYAIGQGGTGNFSGSHPHDTCGGEPYGLLVQNARNLTIDLQGSTLLNTGSHNGGYFHTLCLDGNVALHIQHGFADYATLPWTQGVVTASSNIGASSGRQTITFKPDKGYIPSFTSVQRIEKYSVDRTHFGEYLGTPFLNDPIRENLPISCASGSCTIVQADAPASYRLTKVAIGDHILAESQIYHGDAVRLVRNRGIVFDDFRVWAAAGMGFEAYGWPVGAIAQSDITFINKSGVEVKPNTNRAQSTNADCVHMEGVRGTFTFANGIGEGCRDDAINVYDFHSVVTRISGTIIAIDSARPWAPGDRLRWVAASGVIRGETKLHTMVSSGGPYDKATISVASVPPQATVGDYIEDESNAADCVIEGSSFGRSRGHGILPNCRRFLIRGNRFHDMANVSAISLRFNSGYNQSPYPDGGEIVDNSFDRINLPTVGSTAGALDAAAIFIDLRATNGSTETRPPQLHDIVVVDNHISDTGAAAIYLSGVGSGIIRNNNISRWNLYSKNQYPSAAAYNNNSDCGISIGVAGALQIGPNRFLTRSNRQICSLHAD